MILPKMSHIVVPISKENMVTQTSIIVSGSCLPYPVHHTSFVRTEHTISKPAVFQDQADAVTLTMHAYSQHGCLAEQWCIKTRCICCFSSTAWCI